MDVSENHPLKNGFSIINHPFWGTPIFGNTHIFGKALLGFFLGIAASLYSDYTPRKRTWIPKVDMFERRYIFQGPSFFGIYVRFLGGSGFCLHVKLYSLSQCFSENEGEGRYQVIFNN